MGRETQRKGDLAKAKAISYFTSKNYEVATLLTESAPYDLIVDTGEGLYRVQVKYTSGKFVDLRRIHSNSTGYIVKKYGESDFDWLFVYRYIEENYSESYLIPSIEIKSTHVPLYLNHLVMERWQSSA